ncbi:hypothetical protein ACPV36_19575 [Photobacterium damselae]|uniref:hypothetical protein n=1 Tax=Photobacterium damselae TaxID=38293 RepID=UPI004067726A
MSLKEKSEELYLAKRRSVLVESEVKKQREDYGKSFTTKLLYSGLEPAERLMMAIRAENECRDELIIALCEEVDALKKRVEGE